jgi:hypothetical protein
MESARIIVSACFGAHWSAAERWARHTRFKGDLPVHIVSVDGAHPDDDFGEGVFVVPVEPPSASLRDAEVYRLDFIAGKLATGISCAQVDFDVLLKRDIADLFDIEADFIASRAFRLPQFMSAAFGFVACTGFFIAKPPAAELCTEVANGIRDRRYGDGPLGESIDQYVMNRIFFDEIMAGSMKPFTLAPSSTRPSGASCVVSDYRGAKVAILPWNTIVRGGDLALSTHGIHHRAVLSLFGPDRVS